MCVCEREERERGGRESGVSKWYVRDVGGGDVLSVLLMLQIAAFH